MMKNIIKDALIFIWLLLLVAGLGLRVSYIMLQLIQEPIAEEKTKTEAYRYSYAGAW